MKKNTTIFLTAIFVLTNLPHEAIQPGIVRPEDSKLNFTQLASKYSTGAEEHDVTTEDGYVLKLFHIPGDRNKTVLIMHGIIDSADTFIIRGRNSLVVTLVEAGYDVWVGNFRGNQYSKRHLTLNPKDRAFWDYSLHEFGVFDLPAIIDFILERNELESLTTMAHSLGTTAFFVLGSMRPEYNKKIKVFVALAPVCYVNVEHLSPTVRYLVKSGPMVNFILEAMQVEELFGEKSLLMFLRNHLCTQKVLGYKLCGVGVLSELAGRDLDEFESEFFYAVIGHYPTSTSRRTPLHMLQIANSGQFAMFDYGTVKNMAVYGKANPPLYNLKMVTMRTALFVGLNDQLVSLANVELLKKQLSNIVMYNVMKRKKYNHLDFIWGKNMERDLYPDLFKVLKAYT